MAAKKKTKKSSSTKTATSAPAAKVQAKRSKAKAKAAPKAKAKPIAAKAKAAPKAKAKPNAAKAKPKAPAKAVKAAPKAPAKAVKAAPKAPAKTVKAAPKAKANGERARGPMSRRDATGHLDPAYAADLRQKSRESREDRGADTQAFLTKSRSRDGLAEELGEEAVAAMTSGADQSDRLLDLEVEEERGGPFVRTTGREEFALGTDKSNPRKATREPFPRT